MNKVGLLAALVGAVSLAYVAYPKTDRTPGLLAKVGGAATERDHSQPTALEKLKSATKVSTWPQEGQATLPPPRVVDHVKHEIQARPAATANEATTTAAAPAPIPAATTAGVRPAGTASQSGIDKLVSKLPETGTALTDNAGPGAGAGSRPLAAQAAPTAASTIIIPRSLPAAAVATTAASMTPTSTPSGPAANAAHTPPGPEAAKVAATDKGDPAPAATNSRKSAAKERRRPTQRAATSQGIPRPPRMTSVFGRNDGL